VLPADGFIDEFSDEIGVPIVPGVLLDHVKVDPAQ
jgi:hypothetical protein